MLNRLFEPLRASAAPPASPASAAPPATSGVFALLTTVESVPRLRFTLELLLEVRLELPDFLAPLPDFLAPLPDFLAPEPDFRAAEDDPLLVDPRELEREFPDLLRELAVERFPELERVLVWAILASFSNGGVIPPLPSNTRYRLAKTSRKSVSFLRPPESPALGNASSINRSTLLARPPSG
jgi:hypothetical protein